VPNFGFIKSAAVNQSSMRHTTATRQGSQAKKLEEIKHANNVAVAAKREAVLIKKLVRMQQLLKQGRQGPQRKKQLNQVAEKRAANFEAKKIGDGQKNSSANAKTNDFCLLDFPICLCSCVM
jgi:hypothetical protein